MKMNNQKGFSLVEVLISLGLVGVIALFVGDLMKSTKQYGRYDQSLNEVEDLVNAMYHQSQILEVCENNFADGTAIDPNVKHTTFIDANNNPIFTSGNLGINSTITAFTWNLEYDDLVEKNQVLLSLQFTTGSDVAGSQTMTRQFPLYLFYNTTTNTVRGCIDFKENHVKTVFDQICKGTGAMADTVNMTCYHTGLETTSCGTNKFVNGFTRSDSQRLYVYYPVNCVDKTGMTVAADCGTKQLLMAFDVSGNPTCLDFTSTQMFPGFDQISEACAGSILTLNRNPAAGPVDIDCSGAAVPTPVPTANPCSLAVSQFLAPNPPTSLFGDANWNLQSSTVLAGAMDIIPLGSPFDPYLWHVNDIDGKIWSPGLTTLMYPEIYSFNLETTTLGLGNFYLDQNTSGNQYKITYYLRAVSSQSTNPNISSTAYGTQTCKFTFSRTSAGNYTYQVEAQSCDPARGTHPTATSAVVPFTYTAGSKSINLATRFLQNAASVPACGISIVATPCTLSSTWPYECDNGAGVSNYDWTWTTLAQPSLSFNAPNIWQRQMQVVGGELDKNNASLNQSLNVLDDFKICNDAHPISGTSVKCDMP